MEHIPESGIKRAKKDNGIVNKCIDFDKRILKCIEMMIPVYTDELDGKTTNNDILALCSLKRY